MSFDYLTKNCGYYCDSPLIISDFVCNFVNNLNPLDDL